MPSLVAQPGTVKDVNKRLDSAYSFGANSADVTVSYLVPSSQPDPWIGRAATIGVYLQTGDSVVDWPGVLHDWAAM